MHNQAAAIRHENVRSVARELITWGIAVAGKTEKVRHKSPPENAKLEAQSMTIGRCGIQDVMMGNIEEWYGAMMQADSILGNRSKMPAKTSTKCLLQHQGFLNAV